MLSYEINKILVPIDLSDCSLNALNSAACLARDRHADLHVLNVIEPNYSQYEDGRESENDFNSEIIRALLYNIQKSTGLQPTFDQVEGVAYDAILKESISGKFDLVVIGTHGVSGVREGYLGNTAYNIIKYASCPVLTIPVTQKNINYKRILFPIRPVRGALKRLDIVSKFLPDNAVVDVLALNNTEPVPSLGIIEKIIQETTSELDVGNAEIRAALVTGGPIAENILHHALKDDSRLIVLTSEVDAMSKYNYIGPHAQKLLNNSRLPILSIKRPGIPILA